MSSRATVFAFVLATVFAQTLSLETCPAGGLPDEMDLCDDNIGNCIDEMDLCETTTVTTIAAGAGVASKTGSLSVTVDADKDEVEDSVETGMGNLLYTKGVGSSAAQAKGYVKATATASRRLQWTAEARELAAKSYSVAWVMSFPEVHVSKVDSVISTVTANKTHIENAMLDAFKAAGVTSATSVTVANFAVDVQFEQNSNDAFPIAGKLTTAMALLMSTFALLL